MSLIPPPTLEEAARQFLGVPFLHQGRNPAVGIDCIGLIVCSFIVCAWPHGEHDDPTYGRRPYRGMLEKHLGAAFGDPLPAAQARPSDILTFRWLGGSVCHVGVCGRHPGGGLTVIHTSAMHGRVVEHSLRAPWLSRVAGVYRFGGGA